MALYVDTASYFITILYPPRLRRVGKEWRPSPSELVQYFEGAADKAKAYETLIVNMLMAVDTIGWDQLEAGPLWDALLHEKGLASYASIGLNEEKVAATLHAHPYLRVGTPLLARYGAAFIRRPARELVRGLRRGLKAAGITRKETHHLMTVMLCLDGECRRPDRGKR
jgi:hypothetical protein